MKIILFSINIFFVATGIFLANTNAMAATEPWQNDTVEQKVITTKENSSLFINGITRAILSFLGVSAVLVIISSYFKYKTASGGDDQIEDAKTLFWRGFIVLLVVFAAFGMLYLTSTT